MRWPGSYEQLQQYLRAFTNRAGEGVPYDTNGVLHLLLVLADNLREHAPEAELRKIVPEAVSAEQAAFLVGLARLADQGQGAEPGDTGSKAHAQLGMSVDLSPPASNPAMQILYDLPPGPRETHLEERLLFLCKQDERLLRRLVEYERKCQPHLTRAELLELAIEHFERDNL
jgi:hypothetical protein